MKNRYLYIRTAVFVCDIICIIASFILCCQMRRQKDADLETEMTAAIESLKEENNALRENMKENIDFLLQMNEIEEKMKEAESEYEALETSYQIRMYIDSIAAQLGAEKGSSNYLDRYFRIEKGELEAIINDYSGEKKCESFPMAIEESELFLPIGEKMWIRYGAESADKIPVGLVIQNPTVDIGYRNARAGMTLYDIKRELSGEERTYTLDGTINYYLHYEDGVYDYYYISVDGRDYPTILYIEPK